MRTAEYPRPSQVIAHLSDTHLRDPADPLVRGVVDPRPNLVAALAAAAAHAPQGIVLTGDLSDDGTISSYVELRKTVESAAERMSARVIWVNGNHDDRAAFSEVLLGVGTREPLHQVHRLGGLRVLCLDTTVPGRDEGQVTEESLGWLADQLADPAPEGTVLAMHHSPLPVVQDLAASWELHGQQELGGVLAGSDVRAILSGHFHQSGFGTLAGVPVLAATSLCYTQDLSTGRGLRGQAGGQGWHLVQVYPHTVTSTVAPLGHHPTVVAARSAADSAAELARRDIRIPPAPGSDG
ncbi:metallophosphoesterase [Propionicimonas sp.]|uniref:metallophosphoesterase n=1 Tax=Propionicimonas sp. TaxID=1955623 RepID=UPI0039E2A541